jgi:ABC-type glutathione transport system ATPase component
VSADPALLERPTLGAAEGPAPVLRVAGVHAYLGGHGGTDGHHVLRGVDFHVGPAEVAGIIGETGSGKTTLARAIAGLVPTDAGTIELDGDDLTRLGHGRRRRAHRRAGHLQLVFQDPLRSLDPALRVEELVTEGLAIRGRLSAQERRAEAIRALELVGLDASLLDRIPRDISGGQRQRVSIARALATRPELIVFDEPVSALDATSRESVLRMLGGLRDELGTALVVISHDLASMVGVVDRVVVLFEGRVVEEGPTDRVLRDPQHDYTRLLLQAAPATVRRRLAALPPTGARGTERPSTPRES